MGQGLNGPAHSAGKEQTQLSERAIVRNPLMKGEQATQQSLPRDGNTCVTGISNRRKSPPFETGGNHDACDRDETETEIETIVLQTTQPGCSSASARKRATKHRGNKHSPTTEVRSCSFLLETGRLGESIHGLFILGCDKRVRTVRPRSGVSLAVDAGQPTVRLGILDFQSYLARPDLRCV